MLQGQHGMRLSDEEKATLAGEEGAAREWAIKHQIAVGRFFDAPDLVRVGQERPHRLGFARYIENGLGLLGTNRRCGK